jgi:transposase
VFKEQPDMTFDEIVAAMKKAKIAASRTAVWCFFDRREITFKKKLCTRRSKGGPTAPARAVAWYRCAQMVTTLALSPNCFARN